MTFHITLFLDRVSWYTLMVTRILLELRNWLSLHGIDSTFALL